MLMGSKSTHVVSPVPARKKTRDTVRAAVGRAVGASMRVNELRIQRASV